MSIDAKLTLAALDQLKGMVFEPSEFWLSEKTARELGLDVDKAVEEGWAVRMDPDK